VRQFGWERGVGGLVGALLLLLLCSAPERHAPLISPARRATVVPQWGWPPEPDTLIDVAPPPEFAGWTTQCSSAGSEFFELHDGMLVVREGDGALKAYGGQTGQLRWARRGTDAADPDAPTRLRRYAKASGDAIHLHRFGAGRLAVDLHTGRACWWAPGFELGTGMGDCWFGQSDLDNYSSWTVAEWDSGSFRLHDRQTGRVRRSLHVSAPQGAGLAGTPAGDALVVKLNGSFSVLYPTGLTRAYASRHPEFRVYVYPLVSGFLTVEYPEETENPDRPPVWLSRYDLGQAQPAWSTAIPNGYWTAHQLWNSTKYAALPLEAGFAVYSLADGRQVYRSRGPLAEADILDVSDGALVCTADDAAGTRLCLLELPGGTLRRLGARHWDIQAARLTADWLYCLDRNAEEHSPLNLTALHAIALREGRPQPGTLVRMNLPAVPAKLAERFRRSAAPVDDPVLMREIVAGGTGLLVELLASCPERDTPQLDALAAAAAHNERLRVGEAWHWAAASEGLKAFRLGLAARAGTGLAPTILRWLNDPRLEPLHSYLPETLALCGGPEARAYLRNADATWYVDRPAADTARVLFLNRATWVHTRGVNWQKRNYPNWDGQRAGTDNYVVCCEAGGLSNRELVLAIDRGSDGKFEEVLPLGIADVWFDELGERARIEVRRRGPLKLKLGRGSITVSHHVPVLRPGPRPPPGPDGPTVMAFDDTQYVHTRLSLAQLRRDSDGDGLTDIGERRLLLDPHRADTDGDGLRDGADSAPNVDAAAMGPLERGVIRALQDRWDGVMPGDYPRQATVLECFDCGPLARPSPHQRTLSAATPAAASRYRALLGPGVMDWYREPVRVPPLAQVRQPWHSAVFGDKLARVVIVEGPRFDEHVVLAELEGELYPCFRMFRSVEIK
jgi:hypothetical protein